MGVLDAQARAAMERLMREDYMVDVLDSPIFDGEMYYEFEGGTIVKPDNVGEWKDTGNIVKIMTALGRLDELGEEPYDWFDLEFWSEEVFAMGVEEFLSQCDYDIHYA